MTLISHLSWNPIKTNECLLLLYCFKVIEDDYLQNANSGQKSLIFRPNFSHSPPPPPLDYPGRGCSHGWGTAEGDGVPRQLGKAGLPCRGAALSARWLAASGARGGSAGWKGSWRHFQTTSAAQPGTLVSLGASSWGNALKILTREAGADYSCPAAQPAQPQAPSSPPFPRLSTVGDRFCCLRRLSLPAHLSLSSWVTSSPQFPPFKTSFSLFRAMSERGHRAYLAKGKSGSLKQQVLMSNDIQPRAHSHNLYPSRRCTQLRADLLPCSASTGCSCGVMSEGFSPPPLPTAVGRTEGRGEEGGAQLAPAPVAAPTSSESSSPGVQPQLDEKQEIKTKAAFT